ncbi:MAG: CCA tRNA nucleotidyltransferase, partial [Candidatus Wolfebacteria bacterium]|nr:CCA tRNA nucleotidyltransferase [Candidatus Wolfebacteria bacterium]
MTKLKIPEEIKEIGEKLNKAGFEAYLVGGCVRDILRGTVHGELVEPKDWDVATNAKPDEIQKIFPDSVYENDFGTVGIKLTTYDLRLTTNIVEVTTYRLEGKYSDKRHPDEIKFAKTIEEDLARRDFTINALALKIRNSKLEIDSVVDPYGGQADLKNKIIRAVGEPEKRFKEDALRLMRAVRFAVELNFNIEKETQEAIKKHAKLLAEISQERIRDEFEKIIMTPSAKRGIELLEEFNLLKYIIPELREGIGVAQNRHHVYTVFEHALRSLDYAAKQNYSLEIRVAALFHDIAKPKTKRGDGPDATFYNHEQAGARVVAKILERMRFSKEKTEKIFHLVRYHMFYYNVDEVSP